MLSEATSPHVTHLVICAGAEIVDFVGARFVKIAIYSVQTTWGEYGGFFLIRPSYFNMQINLASL